MMSRLLAKLPFIAFAIILIALTSSAASGSANIVIQNGDSAGVGFNDPTPVAPVGGNNGTTLGQQRLIALQYAAGIWGSTLNSGPPIRVLATWENLTCDSSSGVLGSSGTQGIWRNFPGAPISNTWYGSALANSLAGVDLDPANAEIKARFNVGIGSSGCLEGREWYLGLDTNHGTNINLVTVVLHEFSHGLGFQTFTNSSTTGAQMQGFPSVYDRFLYDSTTGKTWVQMNDAERLASAINTGNLVWVGPRGSSDSAGVLTAGRDAQGRPQMYSPNPVQAGSSVSHWDRSASPNQVMEPNINSSLTHNVTVPHDLTASLFADIGWFVNAPEPTPTPTPTSTPTPSPTPTSTPTPTPTSTPTPTPAPPATIEFSASGSVVAEGASGLIVVTRTNAEQAASVEYSTNDYLAARCDNINGNASSKCDYATAGGTLRFAAGEVSKSIEISTIDDSFVEGNETLSVTLSNPTGATLGSPAVATVTVQDNDSDPNAENPFNSNSFYVRQQYLDFLLREPDSGGYTDWLGVLSSCGPQQGGLGADPGCNRVHVSSGFFRSTEFGEKGYWIYRFYEAALGRRPQLAEFMPEVRRLSGLMSPEEQEARRNDFINRFMPQTEFTSKYSSALNAQSAPQFISELEQTSGISLPENVPPTQPGQPPQYGRSQLISLMESGQFTPAQTLRAFVEQKVVWDTYFYRAFVAMQYFGYLRRDPDNAGYDDWVDVLTNGRASAGIQPGDYHHLIFGFVYSVEYRERFGKP